MALNNQYQEMKRDYNLDNWSIDCFADIGNNISSGTYTAPNTDARWTGCINKFVFPMNSWKTTRKHLLQKT